MQLETKRLIIREFTMADMRGCASLCIRSRGHRAHDVGAKCRRRHAAIPPHGYSIQRTDTEEQLRAGDHIEGWRGSYRRMRHLSHGHQCRDGILLKPGSLAAGLCFGSGRSDMPFRLRDARCSSDLCYLSARKRRLGRRSSPHRHDEGGPFAPASVVQGTVSRFVSLLDFER